MSAREDDRNGTVRIQFEGRTLSCPAGASVATALFAHGIRVLSHSHKFGRPRGLSCARGHCNSCLVRVDGVPNVRACLTPVRDGMRVERQREGVWYARPLQRMMDAGGALVPVGFYFKWFNRPAFLSRLFLRSLRPMTGIGEAPDPAVWRDAAAAAAGAGAPPPLDAEPGGEGERHDHVVVGAGPAGLAAALAAEGRVLLLDDHAEPGGQRWRPLAEIVEAIPECGARLPRLARLHAAIAAARAALAARPEVTWRPATRVLAAYHPDHLLVGDGTALAAVRPGRLTWAAGALDRLGLFPGNDLPGLFAPRALYRVLCRDGLDVSGATAVAHGQGPDLWLAAALLHARGARVTLVLPPGTREDLACATALGWPLHTGQRLAHVRRRGERALVVTCQGEDGDLARSELACDLAVIARPGIPVYDGPHQLGADLVHDPARGGYVPRGLQDGRWEGTLPGGLHLTVAGEAAGAAPWGEET